MFHNTQVPVYVQKERGRGEGREVRREGDREVGRDGGRQGWRQERKEAGRVGSKEGGRQAGKEAGVEGGRGKRIIFLVPSLAFPATGKNAFSLIQPSAKSNRNWFNSLLHDQSFLKKKK